MTKWVSCGQLTSAHGLRGELKLHLTDDHEGRFQPGDQVYIQKGSELLGPFTLTAFRQQGLEGWIRLEGIEDRNQAEALVPAQLQRPAEDLPPLKEGSYYVRDLLGLAVEDPAGKALGRLVDVLSYPANDVYVVEPVGQPGKEVLVPAVKAFIQTVDLDRGVMVIRPIGGMFDED